MIQHHYYKHSKLDDVYASYHIGGNRFLFGHLSFIAPLSQKAPTVSHLVCLSNPNLTVFLKLDLMIGYLPDFESSYDITFVENLSLNH